MFAIIVSLIIVIVLWLLYDCKRPNMYPPGPTFLPIIGSWYCLPAVPRAPDVSKWRKKYGNVIGHRLGSNYIVFVTGLDEILSVIRHPNIQARVTSKYLASRSFNQKLGIFFSDGKKWTALRASSLRYLGQTYFERLSLLMGTEMNKLFQSIKSGEITNVDDNFMRLPINIICILLIGPFVDKYDGEIDTIQRLTHEAFASGSVTGFELFYAKMKYFQNYKPFEAAIVYTHNFFKKCIEDHKKSFDPSEIRDFIDHFFVEAEKEKLQGTNYFTNEDLCTCMLDLLQAGNESTGNTLLFTLMHVALNPHTQTKIHQELDSIVGPDRRPDLKDKSRLFYCQAVIFETMRISPISPVGVAHRVSDDCHLLGYHLKKDTLVHFAHDDVFHNPQYWDEPYTFKPERFLNPENKKKLTNFGIGPRACIGEVLVKNTMFLFITSFFQKYSITLPKNCEKPSTEPRLGITLSIKPYKLIITERERQ